MTEFEPLDYLTVALQGTGLIEASAGTGKTYTLTALYVRLVLGHGPMARFRPDGATALSPKDILVLTFTRAATQELRERIRAKLAAAADLFRAAEMAFEHADEAALQAIIDATHDSFLHDLLQDTARSGDLTGHAKRCADAARDMDLAAIYTLHSFCQRVLKRFAFAAGMAFDQVLQTDTAALEEEIRNDYWRRYIQPLPDITCNELMKHGIESPKTLVKTIRKEDVEPGAGQPFPAAIVELEAQLQALAEVRAATQQALSAQQADLWAWIEAEIEQGHLNRKTHASKKAANAFKDFLEEGKVQAGLELFTPAGLKWLAGKKQTVPQTLTCMDALAAFLSQVEDSTDFPLLELLQHAADWIDAEFDKRLAARTEITYDSMVTRLAGALAAESEEAAQPLADQLFEHYPCTLIDEFQDTDQNQYDIFRHIYAGRATDSHAWFMIGDPKQGIYRFRGADIEVYEQASQNTENRYTLSTNFRSAAGMVAAGNQLFLNSPLEAVEGGVFGSDTIRYHEISAHGRHDQLLIDDEPATPLTLCYPDNENSHSATQGTDILAVHFANRIAALLARARAGHAVIRKPDGQSTAVAPNDMACLVRTGKQAHQLRQALRAVGVDAVFLSEKNSVYDSAVAPDLFRILSAIAHPHDGMLVRQALACPMLAYPADTLVAELTDDERWQQHLRTFRQLRDVWLTRGVLPVVHRLVHELRLPARQRDERVLTDLFHLAELLQQASVDLDGMDALLHYLESAIASHKQGNEDNSELLLRLENERDRVLIMTVHGAKGLEFPLVMLPFACLAQRSGREAAEVAEDMRLLYVGITRAAHACWLGLLRCRFGRGSGHQLESSSLGRLLFGNEHASDEIIATTLGELCARADGMIRLDDTAALAVSVANQPAVLPALANPDTRQPRRPADWTVTSYSRLVNPVTRGTFSPASERLLESIDAGMVAARGQSSISVHAFPRGPEAGNLLHGLLEQACSRGFCDVDQNTITELVAKPCESETWAPYEDQLCQWLGRILNTALPFDGHAVSLAQIGTGVAESEFWLRLRQARLDQLESYAQRLLPGERPPFPGHRINGMLKGFIDLLCCVNGRYYVLDYKSNYLGEDDTAYSVERMSRAMLDHRYELQGLIYQVALHRLLRQRLPDYDPAQHLGGCLFFFLRGIGHDSRGIVHLPVDVAVLNGVDALFDGEKA